MSDTNMNNGITKVYASQDWVKENTIPSPVEAEVGQAIIVKAVDENGKPTEWEAIDASLLEYCGKIETAELILVENYIIPEEETETEIELDSTEYRFIDGELYTVKIGEETYTYTAKNGCIGEWDSATGDLLTPVYCIIDKWGAYILRTGMEETTFTLSGKFVTAFAPIDPLLIEQYGFTSFVDLWGYPIPCVIPSDDISFIESDVEGEAGKYTLQVNWSGIVNSSAIIQPENTTTHYTSVFSEGTFNSRLNHLTTYSKGAIENGRRPIRVSHGGVSIIFNNFHCTGNKIYACTLYNHGGDVYLCKLELTVTYGDYNFITEGYHDYTLTVSKLNT